MSATETITCRSCGETKPVEEFDRRADTGKRKTQCKTCRRKYERERWRCADPGTARVKRLIGAAEMLLCTRCLRSLPAEAFPRRAKGSLRLQSWCRDCFKQVNAANYQRDRDHQMARIHRNTARRVEALRREIVTYLLEHPCVDCGEVDPVVLEFDHVRDKKIDDVTNMINNGSSRTRIWAEIAKCEIRCANCHRRKTARERWSRGGEFRAVFAGGALEGRATTTG